MKPNSLSGCRNDGLEAYGLYCGLLVRVIDRMDTWSLVERSERRFVVLSSDITPLVGEVAA